MATKKTKAVTEPVIESDTDEEPVTKTDEETEVEAPAEPEVEPCGCEDEDEPEEEPKFLTAVKPILYHSHLYRPGSQLPANDLHMVALWTEAGTAAWLAKKAPAAKAKTLTAEPGLPGMAASSEAEDGINLVGKIPKTEARRRK